MSGWTLAPTLVVARNEVNALFPGRDLSSDGTIGDAHHAASQSDHNPNQYGVVRAWDIDVDLLGHPDGELRIRKIAEYLRTLGAAHDRRMLGGYLILDDRIAGDFTSWNWSPYDDDGNPSTWHDPHTSHLHFSCAKDPSGYNDQTPWHFAGLFSQELDVDEVTLRAIVADEVGKALKAGTGQGKTSWGDTSAATLATVQGNSNKLDAIKSRLDAMQTKP